MKARRLIALARAALFSLTDGQAAPAAGNLVVNGALSSLSDGFARPGQLTLDYEQS